MPWRLAAIAHHDTAVSQEQCRLVLADFDASSQNVLDHHRLTWALLAPGPVAILVVVISLALSLALCCSFDDPW